jgi:hypothetical protein
MKNKLTILFIFLISLSVVGCGISTSVANVNSNATVVELSKKNFKVIQRVSGQSTATYFFFIGGLSNKALIEQARISMLENANLIGTSRVVINQTVEMHIALVYPVFFKITMTVSGHVVEFVE